MTTHTDFASTAAAPVHDPWAGTMARNAATPPAAPAPIDTTVTPPSLALHARQVAPPGASTTFASVPGLPDVMRPAGPVPDLDRTLHPAFPVSAPVIVQPSAPLPGTVPAATYDPWRPLQHFPSPAPVAPPRAPDSPEGRGALSADLTAAQFATVAASRAKLDRARSYAGRLGTHAAEIRAKLSAASDRQVAAAIGVAEPDPADVGPLRGELVTVDRQHRQALAALADIEAEHARHEADLAALTGSDGAARAKLAEAHAARALAQAAADDVKAILDRATAHAETVMGRFELARSDEARHDADATARLRAALADGDVLPAAAEPFVRTSGALEDDLRAATAAVEALKVEHAGKASALAAAHRAVLGAADARALALRVRLHCYTARRASDWVAPPVAPPKVMPGGWLAADPAAYATAPAIRTTNVIGAALAAAPVPQSGGVLSNAWAAEHAEWSAYATALAADPQAEPAFADGPATSPSPPLPAPRAA